MWFTRKKNFLRGFFFLLFNPITDQGFFSPLLARNFTRGVKECIPKPRFFSVVSENLSARVFDYSAPALASYNTNEYHTAWIEDSQRKSCWSLIVFWISKKSKNTKYSQQIQPTHVQYFSELNIWDYFKRSPFVLLIVLPESSKVQIKTQQIFALNSATKTLKTIMGKINICQFTAPIYSSLRGYLYVLCCIPLQFSGLITILWMYMHILNVYFSISLMVLFN